jgi:ATPase subunit of ABC transporter with duplicated ATPase domains
LTSFVTWCAQIDAGKVLVSSRAEVGYLEQTAVSGSTRSVWDEARSRMTAILSAEAAMESAAHEMARGTCYSCCCCGHSGCICNCNPVDSSILDPGS